MLTKTIRLLCYTGLGVMLSLMGYSFTTWQYWTLFGLFAVCDISHAFD